jgi:hypothetical protein
VSYIAKFGLLSHSLLKCVLIFAVLPILGTVNGANCQTIAKTTGDLIETIPIGKTNLDFEVFAGKSLRVVRGNIQIDRACNESTRIFWRSGMVGNSDVCKAQRGMVRNDNFAVNTRRCNIAAIEDVNLKEESLSGIPEGKFRLQDSNLRCFKCVLRQFQGFSGDLSGAYSRVGSLLRFHPLLSGVVSVVGGDANQDRRADGFYALSPVLWLFFAVLNLGAFFSPSLASQLAVLSTGGGKVGFGG